MIGARLEIKGRADGLPLKLMGDIPDQWERVGVLLCHWVKEDQLKQVILVKPWEERLENAHECKEAKKYQPLLEDCQDRGWKTWSLPVEIRWRDFVSQSFWRCLGILGIKGKSRNAATSSIGELTETASRWLWNKKEEQWGG